MGKPAARIGDLHVCPMVTGVVPHVGGPIALGSPNVITLGMPQARLTDMAVCTGPPDMIAMGSAGVLVNNLPAARMGDQCAHGGVIVLGAPNVLIGEVGGGASGSGSPSLIDVANGAASFASAGAQAAALIGANQKGSYFCRRCSDG